MLSIGGVFNHPDHGPVYVTSGQFQVNGRISNYWYFHAVQEDGSLGPQLSGYGGNWERVPADVTIIVKIKKEN